MPLGAILGDGEGLLSPHDRAEAGDPVAQFDLAAAYDICGVLPRNDAVAAWWYRLAAE